MQGSLRIDELRQKFHENPRRYFAPLANEYRKAGDPEQAIAICRAHLAQQPAHMSGHVVYGQSLYDAERVDESRTVFEKALSLDPDNAIVLRQLGDIARRRGESAEAKHWYGRALDADPHNKEVAAYIAELTEPETELASAGSTPAVAEAETESVAAPKTETAAAPGIETAGVAAAHDAAVEASPVESATEISAAGEPLAGEPLAEDPLAEDPLAEEPLAEESFAEEPLAEASLAEEAAVEEPPSDEPVLAETERNQSEASLLKPAVERVAWRRTPPREGSPFVTRTMAELYAKQGYRTSALDVFRQLLLIHPDDKKILARIADLTGEASDQEAAELAGSADAAEEHSVDEEFAPQADVAAGEQAPDEDTVPQVAQMPVDSGSDRESELSAWAASDDDEVYAPTGEVIDLVAETPAAPAEPAHFSEMEITEEGDSWDTSTWSAGFSLDDPTAVAVDNPDVDDAASEAVPASSSQSSASNETAAPIEANDSESSATIEAPAAESQNEPATTFGAWEVEPSEAVIESETASTVGDQEPAAMVSEPEPGVTVDEPESAAKITKAETPPVVEDAEPAPTVPEPEPVAAAAGTESAALDAFDSAESFEATHSEEEHTQSAEAPSEQQEDESDDSHLVAYSPQLPQEEDLQHYVPRGPTVREFFATLGARKPPSRDYAQSYTARSAIPASVESAEDWHDEWPDAEPATYEETPEAVDDTPQADALTEYPLAADSFTGLFPESQISEEDDRAAFALSGAMGSSPTVPAPAAPPADTSAPAVPPPPTGETQESEEDIRRFREWLDGLAES